MHASVGDRLDVHGNVVGQPGKSGEIIEVHGEAGGPPYLVRFDDGHTTLVFPGPDAVIEPAKGRKAGRKTAAGGKTAAGDRKRAAAARRS